jgi:hypothetical protein
MLAMSTPPAVSLVMPNGPGALIHGPPSEAPWSHEHQLWRQVADGRLLGSGRDLGEEDLRAPAPRLEQLLAHRRQPHVVGGLDVVVADDREVVRHVEPEIARRGDHAHRLRVAGREDR